MDNIVVYTDGSFMRKGNKCIAGYGIYFPNGELENIGRKFTHKPITNQRAELYAIYKALRMIIKNLDVKKITIYTDSEYSIKSLTIWIKNWVKNNWKTSKRKDVLNKDIIQKIYKIMQNFDGDIEFNHVRSHVGNVYNDRADELAKKGALSNMYHI